MPRVALCIVLVCAACGDNAPVVVDANAACDAVPMSQCGDCMDGICVYYDTESGFTSCVDYDACVPTTLDCPPGTCTPDCVAALCPAPYACDPTATGRFTCTRP